jgi:multidrug efflux pump subunit AcrA (membrane-fusion protein)
MGGLSLTGNTFNPTQEDRDKAKLPPPPDQDSDVSKLLRPGLLADVEVQVEKIPNAIHVPKQAVFEKNNQTVVFVQGANGKFASRVVKVVKQSESMAVLESGVEPGDMVAMSDPTASKDKTKTEEKKSTSATSMMPGGK